MIQLQVLNKILNNKDSSLIISNNLTQEYFSDYKDEFNFINDYMTTYNYKIPDVLSFKDKFPDFPIVEVNDDDNYLIKTLVEDKNKRFLAKTFNKVKKLLESGDVDGAKQLFITESSNITTDSVAMKTVDLIKDTSRYDRYLDKLKFKGNYYISTGFPELDNIIGGWDRQEELATIVARTNYGKCLQKGTKVLMADGTTKNVEDVKVGDKVQSLNRVNIILALHNGVSNGYRIIPNVGDSFVVSSNHILTVMQLKENYSKDEHCMTTDNEFELKDIMVEDYLKLSNHKKHLTKLYRPSIDYSTKEQLIPAYILGTWLGDGTSSRPEITTMDNEIYNEWLQYTEQNNLKLSEQKSYKNVKCKTYDIVGNNGEFRNKLKYYNLLDNKYIPLNYLTGDREQRLELLAGIIDTDGTLNKKTNSYNIVQKSYNLINQIAQLCRGLGFKVGKISVKHNNKYNKDYYRINISGNTNIIPCRLERKQRVGNCKQSEYIVTGFKVEPIDVVEYYGFMCDGDSRYLLADNTLTHNTWILLKCAAEAAKQGLRVGIYSGEMSEDKIGYRIDTLIGHVSNGALTHGNAAVQEDYEHYITNIRNTIKGDIIVVTPSMINGPAGVSALRTFINKEKLDILFVDQHSLLEDDRGAKNPVERAANISKDLKNLQVMEKIPIISVSQQNRQKNEDNSVDTTQISSSDRIGQDSTCVIFIVKKENIMELHLSKSRDSNNGQVITYNVDLNTGEFIYIPTESDGNEVSFEVGDNTEDVEGVDVF